MATIINGKELASQLKESVKKSVMFFREQYGILPVLSVVLVGDDPASEVYVRQKEKACAEVGFLSNVIRLPKDVTQDKLHEKLTDLASDPDVVGILLQLPLPSHLDADKAIEYIPPYKDVDGFTKENTGSLWKGETKQPIPCTPAGIEYALMESGIRLKGKHVVIVGRSNTVGKPLVELMLKHDATVTVCHSKTQDLSSYTRQADVLICAVGKKNLITVDMVKQDAVVIDVGINRDPETNRLCGDVDFNAVRVVAPCITPVPGGVGPLTVAMLMSNAEQCLNLNMDSLRTGIYDGQAVTKSKLNLLGWTKEDHISYTPALSRVTYVSPDKEWIVSFYGDETVSRVERNE